MIYRLLMLLPAVCALSFAQGTVNQSMQPLGSTGNVALTFYWTGDASTGAVPATLAKLGSQAGVAQGYRLLQIETIPGTPAPTVGYNVQLLDSYGGDMLGGAASTLSATAVQLFSASSASPPINGSFSLNITGQSVAGAQGRVVVYFGPTTLVNASAGSQGPQGPAGPVGPVGPGVQVLASSYNFTPQAPGGTLSATFASTVTLTPCPSGVAGTDTAHYLYISGGTGTAEAVLMTGGTCTSGAPTGTVIFTPANNHTGAWSIASATGGIQEAVCALPAGGGQVFSTLAVTLLQSVSACSKTNVDVNKGPAGTLTAGGFTILGAAPATATSDESYAAGSSSALRQSVRDSGPNFATYSAIYDSVRVNTNNMPLAYEFGGNLVPIPQALVGDLLIPVTDTGGNHGAGVAGYAYTFSATKGAVGVFGKGACSVALASGCWGGNLVVDNGDSGIVTPTGYDNTNQYGLEIDAKIFALSGGGAPTHTNVRGLYFVTAGPVHPATGLFRAIDIDAVSADYWNEGMVSQDGAIHGSIVSGGTLATGNNSGPQPIYLHARDGGGVYRTMAIGGDAGGDLTLSPGAGAVVQIQNGSGTAQMTFGPAAVTAATPLVFASVLFANLGASLAAGQYMQCTDCKGVQDAVTAGAACVGTGTGALVRKTGAAFQCF